MDTPDCHADKTRATYATQPRPPGIKICLCGAPMNLVYSTKNQIEDLGVGLCPPPDSI